MMCGIIWYNLRFHVSSLSSAHVYLRMPEDIASLSDIPKEILEECGQLTKENSIQGCKKGSVKIIYTFAANLKKERPMATGEVSFHDTTKCEYFNVSTDKKLIKALMKTKKEEYPNLKGKHK